jgi:hypothetical protein
MKYLLMTLAVVMIFAAPVLADNGNLSQNQLAKLGLSGMSAMSDAQGNAVRGMGFSVAFGASFAKQGNSAGSVNGYLAADSGNHGSLAGGANISVAGSAGSGWFGGTNWNVVGAGGASIAFTK